VDDSGPEWLEPGLFTSMAAEQRGWDTHRGPGTGYPS
jgi:hypothetical protein